MEVVQPLGLAIRRKVFPINKAIEFLTSDHFVSLRFGGAIEPRDGDGGPEYKSRLFWAEAGDLIYSKIDCRNGAIGIVPPSFPRIAVTSEFPVYEIQKDSVIPEYLFLVLQTNHFQAFVNGMVSGASGRKRVQPEELEAVEIPIPDKSIQIKIVEYWRRAQNAFDAASAHLDAISVQLNQWLEERTNTKFLDQPWLSLRWKDMSQWDTKTARAAAFRKAHPHFVSFRTFAEESTDLINPRLEPDHQWPIYGVNNKEGVFFSHNQEGRDFNASYKRIRKDWFFHNPTRASVGSLGHVPTVPEDAITSPEYQVWRLKDVGEKSLSPHFVAAFIRTPWFVRVIQFHRVGAVKQRLYVDNLLDIPIPDIPSAFQAEVAEKRVTVLKELSSAREQCELAKGVVEKMILGILRTEPAIN